MTTPHDPGHDAADTPSDPLGPVAASEGPPGSGDPAVLAMQAAARRHLWLHFTRMSSYADGEVPVIVRGSGQYVYDQKGKRYLDGLADGLEVLLGQLPGGLHCL